MVNNTSAWERTIRRREVIRLKIGKRMDAPDIAEETGFSVQTIRKDFKWIEGQIEKMNDPEVVKEFLMESAVHLMDHETDDLRTADRENDEKAKHRAKQSMRSTMKMIQEFTEGQEVSQEEMSDEDYISELPEHLQEELEEQGEEEVERILEDPDV